MRNLLLAISIFFFMATTQAQQISGIFRHSDADFEYLEQLDWASFLSQGKVLNNKGFRLINLETTGVGNDRRYWGIYTESSLKDTIIKTESWPDFVKAKRSMAAAGYLLSHVQAYSLSAIDAHFIGIWYKDETETPHKIWKLDSPESIRQRTEDMAKKQFYLQEVEVFLDPSGAATYLGLYHYSSLPVRNYIYITDTEENFKEDYHNRFQSKIRLVDYEQFNAKEGAYFLGVYQPGTYDHQFVNNFSRHDFNGKWELFEKDDLKLVSWEVRD